MRWLYFIFLTLVSVGFLGLIVAVGGVVYAISYYGHDLPDYSTLKNYNPPVVTRVYTGDGRLMAEFAQEKRVFVTIDAIPPLVRQAFIAAEDQNFYQHQGLDYLAIMRAAASNIKNSGQGKRPIGASTITQQVAKNFFLTNETSLKRKIREAILAFRMERAMSKDKLLELYLNEIYLGEGTYGVVAAAMNYFGKSLDELTIEQAAFLGALPKAPNNYNPTRRHEAALNRRNWVIGRMEEDGYITKEQAESARAMPLVETGEDVAKAVRSPYFAEEVRRELIGKYGDKSLYEGGLVVRTSIDPKLQAITVRALLDGLSAYDKRHGYRGPLTTLSGAGTWQEKLREVKPPASMPDYWRIATILSTTPSQARFGMLDGKEGTLELQYLSWARRKGAAVTSVNDVLKKGDVIMVEQVEEDGKKIWGLRQIPQINGAVIAMDPHTGRVLAMQGGWSYEDSEFNRATQAQRQPGSSFKPFVYLTALENGFTPATLILDEPFTISQGPGMPLWAPVNYNNEYYGPTPLRVGIEKSRNLMTVRLAQHVGMDKIVETAKEFGVIKNMKPMLAHSLGSGETTLLQMATGYAQLVNGGRKVTPTFIDRIQDRTGATIFSYDTRPCDGCGGLIEWKGQDVPAIPDDREQIADPREAYQIVSIMEGVVERGTATRAKALGRPLAGKTGTTNDSRDTWFIGFSPDLVVGVFVGFDEPRNMGKKETGSSVALPIWIDIMKGALADVPPTPFRVPPGIRQVQINATTGARAKPGDSKVIWESFVNGTEPTDQSYILDGNGLHPYGMSRSYSPDGAYSPAATPQDAPFNPFDAQTPSSPTQAQPADSVTTGTGGLY